MAFVVTAIGAGLGTAAAWGAGTSLLAGGLAGAGIGATLGASHDSSQAAKDAANTQAAAAGNAQQVQWNMFQKQQENLAPWLTTGKDNLATLDQMMKSGQLTRPFTLADFQTDPGYQYRLGQGSAAVEASSAPKWGSMSGPTLKALNDYGQAMGGQEFNNAYNRFTADQTNTYNRYANLAGLGQSAANQVNAAGGQAAGNVSDLMTGAGNALAAGQVGAANAQSQGVTNLAGLLGRMNLGNLGGGGAGIGGNSAFGPYSGGYSFPQYPDLTSTGLGP